MDDHGCFTMMVDYMFMDVLYRLIMAGEYSKLYCG